MISIFLDVLNAKELTGGKRRKNLYLTLPMRRLWTLDGHYLLAPLLPPKNRISEDGHAYLRLRSLASSPKHFAFCIFDNNENNAFKKYVWSFHEVQEETHSGKIS